MATSQCWEVGRSNGVRICMGPLAWLISSDIFWQEVRLAGQSMARVSKGTMQQGQGLSCNIIMPVCDMAVGVVTAATQELEQAKVCKSTTRME